MADTPEIDVTEIPPAKIGGFLAVVAAAALVVAIGVRTLGARLPLPAWATEWIVDDDDQGDADNAEDDE